MPQAQLLNYLQVIGGDKIGMDCSVVPTRFPNIFQVSTTDFFYPLVDDPYVQGKIACANVLSDLYAFGIVNCDSMLMLMGVGESLSPEEKDVVTRLMMKGFNGAKRLPRACFAWSLMQSCRRSCTCRDSCDWRADGQEPVAVDWWRCSQCRAGI